MSSLIWSNYSNDRFTALDTITPSTTTERVDVSRLLRRLLTTTTRRVEWQYIFKFTPSPIDTDSSSALSRCPASSTASISGKTRSWLLDQQQRSRSLQDFLATANQRNEITKETATLAWQAWQAIQSSVDSFLTVPDAGIGPDGEVLFVWKKNELHLELEILPSGQGEIFFINHHSNDMWEYDYNIGTKLPIDIARKLTPFLLYDD